MEPKIGPPAFGLRLVCDEPFRVFFPLGLICGLVGVSHWFLYQMGWIAHYSCFYHGLVQIQGFQVCFIVGFLMTALPKFLEVPAARPYELFLSMGFVLAGLVCLTLERWAVAELSFVALILHTILFAARRFRGRKDRPPDEFVFLLFGFLCALAGGLALLGVATAATGRRLVEQGMTLCFIMGIGGFLIPRLLGVAARVPEGMSAEAVRRTAEETRGARVALYVLTGVLLLSSFILEAVVDGPAGKLLRAAVVTAHFLRVIRVYRTPRRKMWHVRFLHLSLWLILAGLWLAGLFPDYEIVALHLMFIGGFSLITLSIGVRVVVSHCGFESLWERSPAAVAVFGAFFMIALGLRVSADLYPDAYFLLLALAAACWVAGALAWGVTFVPKMRCVDTSA